VKKIIFFLLLISVISGFSYFYSEAFYGFYLKSYWIYFKNYNSKRAELSASSFFEKKDYLSLKKFGEELLYVFPSNKELLRFTGIANLKLGFKERGNHYLLSSLYQGENNEDLRLSVAFLFNQGYYSDLVFAIKKEHLQYRMGIAYYYAVSLIKIKKYKEALKIFKTGDLNKNAYPEYQYYLAYVQEYTENLDLAKSLYKKILENKPNNSKARKGLIRVLRKRGKYKEAEKYIK